MNFYANLKKVVFKNEKTGMGIFSVVPVKPSPELMVLVNSYGEIRVKGIIAEYPKFFPLKISGSISEDDLGKFVKLDEASFESSCSTASYCYLSSLGIPKCEFEDDLKAGLNLYQLSNKMPKYGIKERIDKVKTEEDVLKSFLNLGVNYNQCMIIASIYENDKDVNFKKDVYLLGEKLNISLAALDAIYAQNSEICYFDNFARIEYAVKKVLEAESMQNTCVGENKLIIKTTKLLKTKVFPYDIPYGLIKEVINDSDKFVKINSYIYLKDIYEAETNIPRELKRIKSEIVNYPYSDEIYKRVGIENLGAEQKYAVERFSKSSGIYILTGGPGTGKTTTLNKIIKTYKEMFPDAKFSLCSPTGRAAQRMAQATGEKALTIHKLLDYIPYTNKFSKGKGNPLECDFLIVDECSMIDLKTFYSLLLATKSGCTCLFVGDVNQLEAVGCGRILHNLINDTNFPKVMLNKTYRQKGDNLIIPNAQKVLDKDIALEKSPLFSVEDFSTTKEACEKAIEYSKKLYNPKDILEFQILSSTHKGELGVENLNTIIQNNLIKDKKKKVVFGSQNFYVGDKVMFKRNNYNITPLNDSENKRGGYYNGDIGTIIKIEDGNVLINVDSYNYEITPENYEDLSLAYAMTIHKSQGSEFDTVLIALPQKPEVMLLNNLFYTALTRAKNRVIIISENYSYEISIRTEKGSERVTFLAKYLQEEGL